ncbi:MAG: hypothetical protein ACRD4O_19350 [Bryobacteraceae bacterium]
MNKLIYLAFAAVFTGTLSPAQTFVVTGTRIPPGLLHQSYGSVPKGVEAYDLSICNVTDKKQSVVSSEIYQALSQSHAGLQPIGRQIMLSAILKNQSHSFLTIFTLSLNAASGVLAALGASHFAVPPAVVGAAALGSISVQQVLSSFKPVLSADQVEKFEAQVLEPALVLDAGSCVERSVFTATASAAAKPQSLTFHVR